MQRTGDCPEHRRWYQQSPFTLISTIFGFINGPQFYLERLLRSKDKMANRMAYFVAREMKGVPLANPKIGFMFHMLKYVVLHTDQNMLIFGFSRRFLKYIHDLIKRRNPDIEIVMLLGGASDKDRENFINALSKDGRARIGIVSTKASAWGITLPVCTYILIIENHWNASLTDQAKSRSLRINQMNPVHVVRLVLA